MAKWQKRQQERAELVDASPQAFSLNWVGIEIAKWTTLRRSGSAAQSEFSSAHHSARSYVARGGENLDRPRGQPDGSRRSTSAERRFVRRRDSRKALPRWSFLLEQTEVSPGLWLPSRYQYDFTARKFLFTFEEHQYIEASQYHWDGPPKAGPGHRAKRVGHGQNGLRSAVTFSVAPGLISQGFFRFIPSRPMSADSSHLCSLGSPRRFYGSSRTLRSFTLRRLLLLGSLRFRIAQEQRTSSAPGYAYGRLSRAQPLTSDNHSRDNRASRPSGCGPTTIWATCIEIRRSPLSPRRRRRPAKATENRRARRKRQSRNGIRIKSPHSAPNCRRIDDKIAQLKAVLSGKTVQETRVYGGEHIDDWHEELVHLQKQREDIETRISALQDEARHNGVPENQIPQ